jgi:hypothetical protein
VLQIQVILPHPNSRWPAPSRTPCEESCLPYCPPPPIPSRKGEGQVCAPGEVVGHLCRRVRGATWGSLHN